MSEDQERLDEAKKKYANKEVKVFIGTALVRGRVTNAALNEYERTVVMLKLHLKAGRSVWVEASQVALGSGEPPKDE